MTSIEYEKVRAQYAKYYFQGEDAHLDKGASPHGRHFNWLAASCCLFAIGMLIGFFVAQMPSDFYGSVGVALAAVCFASMMFSFSALSNYESSRKDCTASQLEYLKSWSSSHTEVRDYLKRLHDQDIAPRGYELNRVRSFVSAVKDLDEERVEHQKKQQLIAEAIQ